VALVVFLRGVNVGGHKSFRPSVLAKQMARYEMVNIGAAGTFVVRRPITKTKLRAELARKLPFETQVMICEGREILTLGEDDPFRKAPKTPEVVRFVSVMGKRLRWAPTTPIQLPEEGAWLLKLLTIEQPFVFGIYRRHMKTIGYLGMIDKLVGTPVTTRNWNTISSVIKVLQEPM
jgi:uncharacterized protein (DUF1697 family)